MSERIKLLADQADKNAILEIERDTSLDYLDTYNQKFAELIVRECAEVCYDHSESAGGVDTAFGYGYKDCGNDIKKHFGVE